jgi:hypothetical protein
MLAAARLCAQVDAGVTGGIPLTHFILDTVAGSRFSSSRVTSAPRRYTVGPYVEVRGFGAVGLRAGALYKRFGFDAVGTSSSFTRVATQVRVESSTTGNSWEFPFLGRLYLRHGFVQAGVLVRHLSGIREAGRRAITISGGQGSTTEFVDDAPMTMNRRTSFGVSAGGGVEFRPGRFRLAPEVRITRWDTERTSSGPAASRLARTQVDVLLSAGWTVRQGKERRAALRCCVEAGFVAGVALWSGAELGPPTPFSVFERPARRLAAGALLDWRFHERLSLEGSFVIRRFGHREISDLGGFTRITDLTGYAWEAPLMVKWRPPGPLFVGAGPALRRASHVHWTIGDLGPIEASFLARSALGVAVSGGVEARAGRTRLRPEVRYTWFERPLYDFYAVKQRQDGIALLLGVTWFAARR